MKVTVDVECTPEEARRFMGLPDLSAVHQTYIEKMAKTAEGLTPDAVGEMMKSWGPMSETGLNMWSQMVEQLSGKR